jgi:small-conductance mechanosensitive channel
MDNELLGIMDQQLTLLEGMRASVRRALLWSRSLPAVSLSAFSVAAREIGSLARAAPAIDVPESMSSRPRFTFFVIASLSIGIATSIWGRRWKIPVPEDDEVLLARYDLAFAQRLLRGLAWAFGLTLGFWLLAYWLDTAASGPDRPPLVHLFWGVGWFLLIERSASLVLDPGGFLSQQFSSSRAAAARTLRGVQVLTTSGIVLLAPALVTTEAPYNWERVPQFLSIGWMATVAVLFPRLLLNSSPIVNEWTQPGTPSRRLLVGLGFIVPAVSFVLIVFDLMGYRAGAEALFGNLLRIIVALLILLIIYRIIEGASSRISRAVSRRIIRERGWKEAAKAESKIESFLRRTAATIVIVVVALVLREAWNIGDTLAEMLAAWQLFDAGEGNWVTMLDVVDALIMLVLGIVISQALTKTWELVIAPLRGNEVAGSEYATLTMIRYLVLGFAVAAALLTLNFSLARLGWLLTALSVGLGFGLQEVVANFVSGLILMVERPVRIGDVVTVGTTAGTVDKISIRATMVTNWDRQTIVVPNRNFITQEVTNWTRQDRIVRRTLQVGVAYGTDVERVLAILDELVAAHPKVLRNPAHRIWFHGFGDSSLNFEVWFYAAFDDGLTARSELYTQVYARLNEEQITIPFPQRDVWLRTEDAAGVPGPDVVPDADPNP